ncbi:DUF1835 domain-containing protein [Psychrobacillus sp. OK032]|uniref:DUF1835 domain-containing protein n=1 Tax=Psychrobacillus sp. OK032 TaxID=1884358 RepID=UPI0008CA30EE|nr:DUF1835 domain-containing protein [Psychrobacillus sp. OK032]SES12980.1 protein of unknown function [Psychrobacillus sp. OK032]
MIHKIKKNVEQLSEREAKSLLLQHFLRVQMLEETSYPEEQFLKDMKKEYHDLLQSASNSKQTNYNTIHIVFGDSAAGSLKIALPRDEKVIRFSDLFSIGPVNQLHNEEGLKQRKKWLFLHINMDEQRTFNYIEEFQKTVEDIKNIPTNIPIYIWTANNAHEQTAARFILHILKEKKNDIRLINISTAFQKLWPNIIPVHTGELAAEKLKIIYETYKNEQPLTKQLRNMLADEWEKLDETTEVLRIWEDDQIKCVSESHFDAFIIEKARYLHKELGTNDFMKSARLIGEVLGHSDQYVGDVFFEYRVRQLILEGIFEIEGVPKAMRFYSVKLKAGYLCH